MTGQTNTDNTNNGAWLHALRSDPSPVFKEALRARLRAEEPARDIRREWPRRGLLAAAAVAAIALAFAVPGVRASVAHFVSLFRVVNLVVVPVDSNHLDRLEAEELEIGGLIGEHVEIVRAPGPPVSVGSLAEAEVAAGMRLALPAWLPDDTSVIETTVVGERAVRVTASSLRLQQVMDALGINDLTVPAGLDGHVVDVRVPPVVMIRYEHGERRSRLFQALTPELELPDGINVQALGEIGLRILGLGPAEAKQFAGAIDWHTTLILPVPPTATSFRQVDIGEHSGVLIEHQPRDQAPTTMIVWSTPDRVFALVSIHNVSEVVAMASSVR